MLLNCLHIFVINELLRLGKVILEIFINLVVVLAIIRVDKLGLIRKLFFEAIICLMFAIVTQVGFVLCADAVIRPVIDSSGEVLSLEDLVQPISESSKNRFEPLI